MIEVLRAPFPYPGGKGQNEVVEEVWAALGNVPTYIEPFCGSLAMLLSRPGGAGKYEVAGDANGLLCNVWRAIRTLPEAVAEYCDGPACELDLAARRGRLLELSGELADRLAADPSYCCPQAAGWWVWCQSVSFSPDWLDQPRPSMAKPYRRGILSPESDVRARLAALSERLRRVSIAYGSWDRLVTPSALGLHNTGTIPVGVFFDPPYPDEVLDYGADPKCARDVEEWCRANGDDPRIRIVLCGHVGDYELPGWRVVNWGGSRGWGRTRRGDNEAIWISPHCLKAGNQLSFLGNV